MTLRYMPRMRLGQAAGHIRSTLGNINKALHIGVKVWHATKQHIPDSRMKDIASRGITSYEGVVEKLRAGGL